MVHRKALMTEMLAACFGALLFVAPTTASASEKIFVDGKCQRCHGVSAYGIAKKEEPADPAEEAEDDGDKKESPDLSNTGSFHGADFFTEYLKKKSKHEPAHAGMDSAKKHPIKFKGSDEDLTALGTWLATLKKEPTAK